MLTKTKRVGTLLPMTALVSKTTEPGTFLAGEKFIDWLAKSKQTAWQLLPLNQTQLQKGSKNKHVPSPYKGYGVGLDPRFLSSDAQVPSLAELTKFVKRNNYWLPNYALFCALRDHFGTDNWSEWPEDIRNADSSSIEEWQRELAPQISLQIFTQAQLDSAYNRLKNKAVENNILLIGDMPFYVGLNSPLVWRYQHLFDLGKDGKLERVSGVLFGSKSHFGRQVWGHPLYKWQDHSLWPELNELFEIRIRYLASIFDWVRLDHAKGLFSYGVIDLVNHELDYYLEGPGQVFLEKLISFARKLKLQMYAEDTGDKLKELRRCLRLHRLPGVKIFRFAYNEKRKIFSEQYLEIEKYPTNTFAYTTTHDTETLFAYLSNLESAELEGLVRRLNIKKPLNVKLLTKIIRKMLINSPAKIVLIPLQDWLLTTDRINVPGSERELNDKNWQYTMNINIEDLPIDIY